jgi:uncharacterized protein
VITGSHTLSFVADSTLGRLAKNLRLAGFDTLFDKGVPDSRNLAHLAAGHRIVLTRSTHVKAAFDPQQIIFINDDRASEQMRQVLALLGLKREDLRPLSRCARCNRLLDCLPKEQARGQVPDYVWQQHDVFRQCINCRKVYWQGSHAERWKKHMHTWFAAE